MLMHFAGGRGRARAALITMQNLRIGGKEWERAGRHYQCEAKNALGHREQLVIVSDTAQAMEWAEERNDVLLVRAASRLNGDYDL